MNMLTIFWNEIYFVDDSLILIYNGPKLLKWAPRYCYSIHEVNLFLNSETDLVKLQY